LRSCVEKKQGAIEINWENAFRKFIDNMQAKDASDATVKAYRSDLCSFAKWYAHTSGSQSEVAGVGPLDVTEYKRYLVTRKKKPAKVNRALASLRAFFSWAAGEGLVDSCRQREVCQISCAGPEGTEPQGATGPYARRAKKG